MPMLKPREVDVEDTLDIGVGVKVEFDSKYVTCFVYREEEEEEEGWWDGNFWEYKVFVEPKSSPEPIVVKWDGVEEEREGVYTDTERIELQREFGVEQHTCQEELGPDREEVCTRG